MHLHFAAHSCTPRAWSCQVWAPHNLVHWINTSLSAASRKARACRCAAQGPGRSASHQAHHTHRLDGHFPIIMSKLGPAENIIDLGYPLRTHLMKRRSIPVHQGNACKGSEVLTRDIYFSWRNSLKCLTKPKTYTTFTEFEVLTHKGKEMRQQTPSAVTSSVLTSLEGSQTCQQPSDCSPYTQCKVRIVTDGISCQTLKCFDSVKKFMRTWLS